MAWGLDDELKALIEVYFAFAHDRAEARKSLTIWLASEIGSRSHETCSGAVASDTEQAAPGPRSKNHGPATKRDGPWMTAREAAEVLERSQKTLANWRSGGKGPPFKKRGGVIRYRRTDVERWLEKG